MKSNLCKSLDSLSESHVIEYTKTFLCRQTRLTSYCTFYLKIKQFEFTTLQTLHRHDMLSLSTFACRKFMFTRRYFRFPIVRNHRIEWSSAWNYFLNDMEAGQSNQ